MNKLKETKMDIQDIMNLKKKAEANLNSKNGFPSFEEFSYITKEQLDKLRESNRTLCVKLVSMSPEFKEIITEILLSDESKTTQAD